MQIIGSMLEQQAHELWWACWLGRQAARNNYRATASNYLEVAQRIHSDKSPALNRIAADCARDINHMLTGYWPVGAA